MKDNETKLLKLQKIFWNKILRLFLSHKEAMVKLRQSNDKRITEIDKKRCKIDNATEHKINEQRSNKQKQQVEQQMQQASTMSSDKHRVQQQNNGMFLREGCRD